jgi:hypothetical protein
VPRVNGVQAYAVCTRSRHGVFRTGVEDASAPYELGSGPDPARVVYDRPPVVSTPLSAGGRSLLFPDRIMFKLARTSDTTARDRCTVHALN